MVLPSSGLGGKYSLLSPPYIVSAIIICFPLFKHETPWADCLLLENTGKSKLARMPMTAMTTSSSIRVKPRCRASARKAKKRGDNLLFFPLDCILVLYFELCRHECQLPRMRDMQSKFNLI